MVRAGNCGRRAWRLLGDMVPDTIPPLPKSSLSPFLPQLHAEPSSLFSP